MFGFHIVDILVIIAYFAAMLYIGYRAMLKIKNQEDFFLGGRSFGRFLQTFLNFGQATSSETAVTSSSIVGQKGLAGVFFSVFSGLFTLPLAWFTPLWFRRSRVMTTGTLLHERFNSTYLGMLYAVAQASLFILVGGMGFYSLSKTAEGIAFKEQTAYTAAEKVEYQKAMRIKELEKKPAELLSVEASEELTSLRRQAPRERFSYLNRNILIIFLAAFIVLYAIGGGLEAAVWTDAIQSIFILVLTVMLFPFAMAQLNSTFGTSGLIGPFQAVHKTLPASMLELFGSPKLAGFTWQYIILLSILGSIGSIAFANALVVCAAAKSEEAAREGSLNGMILKRTCTVIWSILALFILVLYGSQTKDPDLLWGVATKNLLPIGLVGLMVSSLLAALMSTADAHMLVVSGLLTQNIYRPLVGKNKDESHFLKAGRVFGLVYIIGAVLVAMNSDNLFEMLKYMIMINGTMGPCILMTFLWRKTNLAGAWVSMGISILLTIVIPLIVTLIPVVKYNPNLHLEVQPPAIVKTYQAKTQDVQQRQKLIAHWDMLNEAGKASQDRPLPLREGDAFEQTFQPPAKAVFWTSGIKEDRDGKAYGAGLFRTELYLMQLCGMDLVNNAISTNECISLLFKLIFPFGAIFILGYLTKPVDQETLDRFYGKLLTPVNPDHDQDAKEIALTFENPRRFDHTKLFPNSHWYIRKWNWMDWKGFIIVMAAIVLIGLFMYTLATLGS
ncbi:MAG: sodium:solute symporter family protein [Planctomycetota bacterium]|jgi:SSS family solute:Na+ symporter